MSNAVRTTRCTTSIMYGTISSIKMQHKYQISNKRSSILWSTKIPHIHTARHYIGHRNIYTIPDLNTQQWKESEFLNFLYRASFQHKKWKNNWWHCFNLKQWHQLVFHFLECSLLQQKKIISFIITICYVNRKINPLLRFRLTPSWEPLTCVRRILVSEVTSP